MASDPSFRKVVATKRVNTSAAAGHSVKARVTGLDAGERYYYRFAGRSAESAVGRFQTALPADSNEPVRFAFFSCQEYSFGYFNAHRLLAREDVDFVVNLGDYIYSDVAWSRRSASARATSARSSPRRRSTSTATATPSTAPTPTCARCTRSSP